MINKLSTPEMQPQYMKGFEAYQRGEDKNPFEHMTMRMNCHKIYWQMGWAKAQFEDSEDT